MARKHVKCVLEAFIGYSGDFSKLAESHQKSMWTLAQFGLSWKTIIQCTYYDEISEVVHTKRVPPAKFEAEAKRYLNFIRRRFGISVKGFRNMLSPLSLETAKQCRAGAHQLRIAKTA